MSRAAAPLALIALALLGMAACGGGSEAPKPTDDGAPKPAPADDDEPRDALVIAYQSDYGNLNPIVSQQASDSAVMVNTMIQSLDSTFDCKLTYTPMLFDSWTWSEDHTLFTVKLREDIKFSDGETVDADDVVFTYELVRDPAVASPRLQYVEKMVEGYPKATGPFEVQFKYTEAYDELTMMAHASLGVIPKHVFETADRGTLRGHPQSMEPLSSGPWRLKLHEPNSRFVLEPNPDWSGPASYKPHLKRVVFKVLPEYTTRLTELRNGTVDLMEGLNIEDIDALKETNPEIKFYSRGYRFSDYVAWNTENPLFADKDVRRALTMAMDIDDMIAKLITGKDGKVYARKAVSTITPELCAYHADEVPLLPHDDGQAKQILASKGWTDSDGDGFLDKDGKTFEFTLATNAGNKRRADASILIQAQLKDIGVKVNLEQRESNVFFESLRKRDYEAALAGWSAGLFVDPADVWSCDKPDEKREFNFTGYCNAEVDALIAKGLTTPDPAAQIPIWKEFQAKVYEDQPYTFLWWREEFVGLHDRFEDVGMDVLSLLTNLHQWKVPADKVKYER